MRTLLLRSLIIAVFASVGLSILITTPISAATFDGTALSFGSADDAGVNNIPLGFDFTFYGNTYSSVNISINGFFSFSGTGISTYSNAAFPDTRGSYPTNMVAPFWDDLYLEDNTAKVLYSTIGTAPNRKFVVQWSNIYFCCGNGLPMGNLQAILYEGSNNIKFQYSNLAWTSRSFGNSATIGLENSDNTLAAQYSYNVMSINDGLGILFTWNPETGNYNISPSNSNYEDIVLNIGTVPTSPVLTSPADDAQDIPEDFTFDWEPAALATSYKIIIASGPIFDSEFIIYNQAGLTETSFDATNLPDARVFYWRVQAMNNDGGTYSPTYTFSTVGADLAPLPTTLSQPTDGATNVSLMPTLSWSWVASADSYSLEISGDENFNGLALQHSLTDTQYTLGSRLNGETTYYWRVTTHNESGSTESETGSFTTMVSPYPGSFTLTAPIHSSTITNLTPTFTWNESVNTNDYTIKIDDTSDFTDTGFYLTESGLIDTEFTYPGSPALELGNTYYWKVIASNEDGNFESSVYSFTIGEENIEPEPEPSPNNQNSGNNNSQPTQTLNKQTVKVQIKVSDAKGNPVVGAKVTLHSDTKTATTNHDGIASFFDVELGSHEVVVEYGEEIVTSSLMIEDTTGLALVELELSLPTLNLSAEDINPEVVLTSNEVKTTTGAFTNDNLGQQSNTPLVLLLICLIPVIIGGIFVVVRRYRSQRD